MVCISGMKMNRNRSQFVMMLVALTLTPGVMAGVYKYVDANGNTIYTDQQPKGEASQVEKLNVKEAYTNTMPGTVSKIESSSSQPVFEQIQQQQKQDQDFATAKRKAKKAAKQAVDDAKSKLEEAKVIQAGDMLKNVGGGIRYTQQYLQRVEAAQMALDAAQKEYSQF